MSGPPENEKGAPLKESAPLNTYGSQTVARQPSKDNNRDEAKTLWPTNVERLCELGVEHRWRQYEHDLLVTCPTCGHGALIIHESEKWHHCPQPTCSSWTQSFGEIIDRLAAAKREVT